MSQDHEALIETFYEAFTRRDAETMASCYHDDVVFSDPVFPDLKGWRAGAMWRMLCERGKDLELTYSGISASGDTGRAHWEADYTFSATGRKVHNVIDASFRFADGKIIEHTDVFDLWAWTRQALGAPGVLLGWTPIIQGKVRGQAAKGLDQYIASRELAPG